MQLHLTSFSSFAHVCKGIHCRALCGNIAEYGEDNEGKHWKYILSVKGIQWYFPDETEKFL